MQQVVTPLVVGAYVRRAELMGLYRTAKRLDADIEWVYDVEKNICACEGMHTHRSSHIYTRSQLLETTQRQQGAGSSVYPMSLSA